MKFFSVTLPSGHPAVGDTSAEAAAVFAAADQLLVAEGMSLRDVVHTRFFYSAPEDFPPMAAVRARVYAQTYTENDFPSSSGLVAGPHDDGRQNLEIEFIAGRGKQTFHADTDTTTGPVVASPYRHAASAEGLLYVSGFLGSRGDDTATQFAHSARNLRNAFAGAHTPMSAILALSVYVSASTDIAVVTRELDTLIRTELGGTVPVVSVISVYELSFEGFLVAIEAVASACGTVVSAPARSTARGELDENLPLRASAAEAGGWVLAAGFSRTDDETVPFGELFRAAVGEGAGAIAELAPTARVERATVWFAPASARDEVVALARAQYGDSDVNCFPLRLPAADTRAVRLQLTARAVEAGPRA